MTTHINHSFIISPFYCLFTYFFFSFFFFLIGLLSARAEPYNSITDFVCNPRRPHCISVPTDCLMHLGWHTQGDLPNVRLVVYRHILLWGQQGQCNVVASWLVIIYCDSTVCIPEYLNKGLAC